MSSVMRQNWQDISEVCWIGIKFNGQVDSLRVSTKGWRFPLACVPRIRTFQSIRSRRRQYPTTELCQHKSAKRDPLITQTSREKDEIRNVLLSRTNLQKGNAR